MIARVYLSSDDSSFPLVLDAILQRYRAMNLTKGKLPLSANEIVNIIREDLMSLVALTIRPIFPAFRGRSVCRRGSIICRLKRERERERRKIISLLVTHPVSSRSHHRMELIAMEWRGGRIGSD